MITARASREADVADVAVRVEEERVTRRQGTEQRGVRGRRGIIGPWISMPGIVAMRVSRGVPRTWPARFVVIHGTITARHQPYR